jgi:hypothetical protein
MEVRKMKNRLQSNPHWVWGILYNSKFDSEKPQTKPGNVR